MAHPNATEVCMEVHGTDGTLGMYIFGSKREVGQVRLRFSGFGIEPQSHRAYGREEQSFKLQTETVRAELRNPSTVERSLRLERNK